jgi:hypothetical protein
MAKLYGPMALNLMHEESYETNPDSALGCLRHAWTGSKGGVLIWSGIEPPITAQSRPISPE